jgi:hypothetical protein
MYMFSTIQSLQGYGHAISTTPLREGWVFTVELGKYDGLRRKSLVSIAQLQYDGARGRPEEVTLVDGPTLASYLSIILELRHLFVFFDNPYKIFIESHL